MLLPDMLKGVHAHDRFYSVQLQLPYLPHVLLHLRKDLAFDGAFFAHVTVHAYVSNEHPRSYYGLDFLLFRLPLLGREA